MNPYSTSLLKSGKFLSKINFSAILDGTSKTLGVINQAIPIFYQVKPLFGNTKTLLNLAKAINEPEEKTQTSQKEVKKIEPTNSPIFYL